MKHPNPTVNRPICGTMQGYRKHQRLHEKRCTPCQQAALYNRTGRIEKAMNDQEIAEEIDHLLKLSQGQHTILQALGNPRKDSLQRRLYKANRPDLIPRLFHMQDQAA